MNLSITDLNWLAIIAATLATFFLGGIWYSSLSKLWIRLHNYAPEQLERMKKLRPPPVFFGGMIVSYFVVCVVLAILVNQLDPPTLVNGLILGALLWLGVALPINVTGWLASDKHFGVYAIDLAYQLAFLLMDGAILGAWR
jgi:hypothetical protein